METTETSTVCWGVVSRCRVTHQLIQEALETFFSGDQVRLYNDIPEAEHGQPIQAWILDEVVMETCLQPFIVLQDGKKRGSSPISAHGFSLFKPFRLVDFHEHLLKIRRKLVQTYCLGPYLFNASTRSLHKPDGSTLSLREKESDLLLFLLQSSDQKASRQALLSHVWNYQPGITTHTLETHIYQLRQKLESDPSNPSLLISEERGYRLQI